MNGSATASAPLPGLGWLSTVLVMAVQTVRQLLQNRFVWLLHALQVGLAGLAFLLGGLAENRLDGRELYCILAWWLAVGVVLPWSTIYLAVQAIHGELEDRTFQYLFLRPVGRGALLFGKWAAVALVAAVSAGLGGVLLFVALAARPGLWEGTTRLGLLATFVPVLAIGAVAYASVGACFAAVFRRPLVLAAVAVLLQTVVTLLPVSAGIRDLTVADPLRRLVLDGLEPGSRLARMLWPSEQEFRAEEVGQPLLALGVYCGITLLLAVAVYRRAEYDSRARE